MAYGIGIIEIKVERVFNLGNYESQRVCVTVGVDTAHATPDQAYAEAQAFIHSHNELADRARRRGVEDRHDALDTDL